MFFLLLADVDKIQIKKLHTVTATRVIIFFFQIKARNKKGKKENEEEKNALHLNYKPNFFIYQLNFR